jgi:lipoprotein NlpI
MTPSFAHGYEVRGWAKEFKGDMEGAVADLARASRINISNAYPQIFLWIVRTLQGETALANQELAAYVDRHVEKSTDHWGTKVSEFLLGRISESDFLGTARSVEYPRFVS